MVGRRGGREKFGTERGGKGRMVDGQACGPCGVTGVPAASGGLLGSLG